MKYSVIIPIYQAEKTIRRCLDSLAHQKELSVEILMIDDGSTDRSGDICKEFCNRDSRFQYYYKENGGVSTARNLGLNYSKGDYILFVDCDDHVSEQYFDTLNAILDADNYELVLFSVEKYGRNKRHTMVKSGAYQNKNEIAMLIAEQIKRSVFGPLWSKLFLRTVIEHNHLRFLENISVAEDLVFCLSYALCINYAASSDQILYYADESNPNSLSRKPRKYLADHLYTASEAMFQSLEKARLPRTVEATYRKAIKMAHYRSVYSIARDYLGTAYTPKERKKLIKQTCQKYTKPFIWPEGLKGIVVAIPVVFRLSSTIDYLAQRRAKRYL